MDVPSDAAVKAARAEADSARDACREGLGYCGLESHRAYLLAELVSAELRALTAAITEALDRLAPERLGWNHPEADPLGDIAAMAQRERERGL